MDTRRADSLFCPFVLFAKDSDVWASVRQPNESVKVKIILMMNEHSPKKRRRNFRTKQTSLREDMVRFDIRSHSVLPLKTHL